MTRPIEQLLQAKELLADGLSQAEAARRLGIPRSTVRTWMANGFVHPRAPGLPIAGCDPCAHINGVRHMPEYAYLLGMYLGDGNISSCPRGVYRLRITCDDHYPGIITECQEAMAAVLPNRIGLNPSIGCTDVSSYSKHWPCLFPQHGKGPKHRRPILLEPWQHEVAIMEHPKWLLRGLIHSDGWRGMNVAVTPRGRYYYTRYMFSNRSPDIQAIFSEACARLGIETRQANRWNVAVSKRADVAYLDQFIGRKH